jgi:hypothetical protein
MWSVIKRHPGKGKDKLEMALERGDQAIAEGRVSIHGLHASKAISKRPGGCRESFG